MRLSTKKLYSKKLTCTKNKAAPFRGGFFIYGGKMTKNQEIEVKLKAPFPKSDIEFRIAKVNKQNRKAQVLAYITSRAVMDRLDAVFGSDKWSDEYDVLENGVTCRLSAKLNGDFITKQDAAPFTEIEALKGAFSDALKRASVKFGIGRYLYNLPNLYVEILPEKPDTLKQVVHYYVSNEISGWWVEPDLPDSVIRSEGELENQNPTVNFHLLTLYQKLSHLVDLEVITSAKHSDYIKKLDNKTTGPGLLKYFNKQCDLLYNLYLLVQKNKISTEQRMNIYNRVMSTRMNGFPAIEKELKQLEVA